MMRSPFDHQEQNYYPAPVYLLYIIYLFETHGKVPLVGEFPALQYGTVEKYKKNQNNLIILNVLD